MLAALPAARATWNEFPVGGAIASDVLYNDMGAYDSDYGVYWCTTTASKLYAVYYNGSAWTSALWASNASGVGRNCLAVDKAYHWVFYRGTDGYVWLCYYTGSAWTAVKVGTNVNNPSQFCVDSGYHILWYLDNSGYLWALYHNGTAFVETKIDGVNQRYTGTRSCGVDEQYHFVWNISSDRKSLRYSYHNGSIWTSTAMGTLGGTDLYNSLCVHAATHQIYNWQMTNTLVPIQVQSHYWTGSAWASWTCLKDGNLPTVATTGHYCVQSPDSYACYFGATLSGATSSCLFTNYSGNARAWTSCRQDQASFGGGGGLFPVAIGHGGRSALCRNGNNTSGPKIIYSDL